MKQKKKIVWSGSLYSWRENKSWLLLWITLIFMVWFGSQLKCDFSTPTFIYNHFWISQFSSLLGKHKNQQRGEEDDGWWEENIYLLSSQSANISAILASIDRRKWKVIYIVCVRVCVLPYWFVRGLRFVPYCIHLNVSPGWVCVHVSMCLYVCGCVLSLLSLIPFVMKHLPISPFINTQQEKEERGSVYVCEWRHSCVSVCTIQLLSPAVQI